MHRNGYTRAEQGYSLYGMPMIRPCQREGESMLHLGEITIDLVNDARIYVDAGGPFGLVPRALFSRYLIPDQENRVPMDHNCLLVSTAGKTILVDTGLGTKLPEKAERLMVLSRPEGGLVAGLARRGVAPGDVEIVINTHLHNDHCGGNTLQQPGGGLAATFPNAKYLIPQREYEDALHPNERTRATYFAENFMPLQESGQMILHHGDIEVVPGVRIVPTPGHTPGHTSILFESDGKSALYVADLASYAVHFAKLAWMTAYDVEPLVTLETKRHWQTWALQNDALLIFEHDPLIRVGQAVDGEAGFDVLPASVATG